MNKEQYRKRRSRKLAEAKEINNIEINNHDEVLAKMQELEAFKNSHSSLKDKKGLINKLKAIGVGSWVIVVIVIVLLWITLMEFVGIPIEYSKGERAGVVTKISKKGLFYKTWEGELAMYNGTFEFSVADDKVVAEIQAAAESGNRVTLFYDQWWEVPGYLGKTDYLITSVKTSPARK